MESAAILLHEILHWAGAYSVNGKYESFYTDKAVATAWELRVVLKKFSGCHRLNTPIRLHLNIFGLKDMFATPPKLREAGEARSPGIPA